MEYNNYYINQPGHPPGGMPNHQHVGPQMQQEQQQPPTGGQIMHAPMSSQNIRQPMPSGHPNHHPQQQLIGNHPQQMSSQQPQHPSYHQIQSPHPHGPPLSHSGSPHPQQQQQSHHNHQPSMSGPMPQHHHIHPQSPHHNIGPPSNLHHQPQQLNHIVRPPPGHSYMSPPQPGLQQPPPHHQNFFGAGGGGGGQIHQPSIHHYPQQNQSQPPHPPQHHHQSPMMHHHAPASGPNAHMQQGFGRNSPYHQGMPQTEIRILELNRRLQSRSIPRNPVSPLPNTLFDDSPWWERFASEFFDDDATLTIRVIEDKEIIFKIGRTLIPRFFRTYFDGGATDLSINLKNPREILVQNNVILLDCDQTYIVTSNSWRHSNHNPGAIVQTEGHLSVEFVSNNFDNLLIKSWKFTIKNCREYIDRSTLTAMGYSNAISEPITRYGLTKSTISYLKMCMIIEPMQDLMSQHKQTNIVPRECLRRYLAERFKFRPEDSRTSTNKRRKRKPSSAPMTGATTNKRSKVNVNNTVTNNSGLNNMMMSPSGTANFTLATQDVMVVGEPSMMGGDFGDDNERMITRLENTQYEPATGTPTHPDEPDSMMTTSGTESNGLNSTNNIESDLENHTLSPSLLQQRQQTPKRSQSQPEQTQPSHQQQQLPQQQQPQQVQVQQQQKQEVPPPSNALEAMVQQVEQQSPSRSEVHRVHMSPREKVVQDEPPVLLQDGPTNLIEDTDVQQRDEISQTEQKPVISSQEETPNGQINEQQPV